MIESEKFAVLAVCSLLLALFSTFLNTKYRILTMSFFCLFCLFGIAFGFESFLTPFSYRIHPPLFLALAPIEFDCTKLASSFSILANVLLIAFGIFSPSYMKGKHPMEERLFLCASFVFAFSMQVVLFSGNAILFLIFWELMSLSSAALVASEVLTRNTAKAALIYLSATRIATALIAGGFLAAYMVFKSWNFADWNFADKESLIAQILITMGCLIKSGIWPFHIWLPYAHPAAPAPVSALMSGLMIKIPVLVLIQFFFFHEQSNLVIPVILIVLGAVSSLWGIIFALVQNDLKKILAYSSVENIGLIVVTLGVSALCRYLKLEEPALVLLLAALFHSFNHAIFKFLLFLSAGSIYKQTHSTNINELGALAHKMPGTFIFFLIGCAALCSLPPLNGFCSKWLMYEGLFKLAILENNFLSVLALVLICILIIAGTLSLATFSKTVAIVFTGRSRTKMSFNASESDLPTLLAQGFLALLCVFAALFYVPLCNCLTNILGVSKLALEDTYAYLWTGFLFVFALYTVFLKQKKQNKINSTWECGFGPLSSRMQQTSESFSQPIAVFFSPVLRYRIVSEITGKDRRHFPEKVKSEQSTQSVLESKVYTPLVLFVSTLGRHINKLQAGSIHIYLSYLLLTLIGLICLEILW